MIPFLFIGLDIGILETISYGVFKLNKLARRIVIFCINDDDGEEFFAVVAEDDDVDCCPNKLSVII